MNSVRNIRSLKRINGLFQLNCYRYLKTVEKKYPELDDVRLFKGTYTFQRRRDTLLTKKGTDPRARQLKRGHFLYDIVEHRMGEKAPIVEVLLTDYVEGVGHKGQIVQVTNDIAISDLIPSKVAVYPTEEQLKLYEKDTEISKLKPKISRLSLVTLHRLESDLITIPINLSNIKNFDEWKLDKQVLSTTFRYCGVMLNEKNIVEIKEEITKKNIENYIEEKRIIEIPIQINSLTSVTARCQFIDISSKDD
ncbi:hypothetical protein SNEBB_007366 [Seison nebaliae]|nr:hypothetical protein SNEBB_007366 [Seison nebaliae]